MSQLILDVIAPRRLPLLPCNCGPKSEKGYIGRAESSEVSLVMNQVCLPSVA